jgi:hypothetical protein
MSDLKFYESLDDYDAIKEFLELDPEGYEPPVDIAPFMPGASHHFS